MIGASWGCEIRHQKQAAGRVVVWMHWAHPCCGGDENGSWPGIVAALREIALGIREHV